MKRSGTEQGYNPRFYFRKGCPKPRIKCLTKSEAPRKELSGFCRERDSLFEERPLTGRKKSSQSRGEKNNPCLSSCIYPMKLLPGFLLATKKPAVQPPGLKSRNGTIRPRQTSPILTYPASSKANFNSQKTDCQFIVR